METTNLRPATKGDIKTGAEVFCTLTKSFMKVYDPNETERFPKNENTIVLTKDGRYAVNAMWVNLKDLQVKA